LFFSGLSYERGDFSFFSSRPGGSNDPFHEGDAEKGAGAYFNAAVAVKSLEDTERHMYTMYVQYTSIYMYTDYCDK